MRKTGDVAKENKRIKGRLLKSVDPYLAITPYLMRDRNDAMVNAFESVDVTDTMHFIHKMRAEDMPNLGMLHLFVASYVRMVSQVPQVNRFITGQRVYARTNIEVIMTVKKEMRADAPETSIKVVFEPSDILKDVYEKMNTAISEAKSGNDTSTDTVARWVMSMPRFILRGFMAVIRWMDYHACLPKAIMEASPFHGSMIVTDVASIGLPPVLHHIYNFGNLPVFTSFGRRYRKNEMDSEGNISQRQYIDYGIVIDERICDGFTYAKALRIFKNSLKNPYKLMVPPERVFEDVG